MEYLETLKLSDIHTSANRQFIYLAPSSTIGQALQTLHDKGIRLIPIIDASANKLLGTVNALDICGFIAANTKASDASGIDSSFFGTPITQVLQFFKTEASMPMFETFPIKLAIQALCGLTHSIPLSNQQGTIIDIITQSDINKLVATDIRRFLGDKAGKSVEELGLIQGSTSIQSVSKDARVFGVLDLLYEKKLTALAILDDKGSLLGTFSASDLRKLTATTFSQINDPLDKFLDLEKPPVVITNTASLGTVVRTLVEKNVHRVWIVDDNRRPIGIVSLTDIMRQLSPSSVRATTVPKH